MNGEDVARADDWFGRRVLVCFDYDFATAEPGTIIGDDRRAPTVIELDTGRVVLSTQCQWRPIPEGENAMTNRKRWPVISADSDAAVVIRSDGKIANDGVSNPYANPYHAMSHAVALMAAAKELLDGEE